MEETTQSKAVERPGAPEHLDRVLYVTTPKGWLALGFLLVILGAVVAWSVLGKVSTYVDAEGIIISRGGVIFDVTSTTSGKLSRILPTVGDVVTEGDLVAELFDAETLERHAGAMALAREWEQTLRLRETEAQEENALIVRNLARRRARLAEIERSGRELIEATRKRLEKDKTLLARGVANRSKVESGEQALDLAQRNLIDTMRRRDEMEAEDLRRRNALNFRISEARTEYADAQRQVNELSALIESWRITVPTSGRVTEIKAQIGTALETGASILSIESGGKDIDVLFFAPPADGKRIKAGLRALVSPTTAKREEFGYMIGVVESRSEFPMSIAGMVATLHNEKLAQSFSIQGAPYSGRITLTPDASTASGFAWTSPQAKAVEVTPGTLATLKIRLSRRAPIALIAPWIKEKFDF